MELVFTAPTMFMVAHIRNLLEAQGIECHIRNEFLSAGAGELPPTEVWPEVWVADDAQAERARRLIAGERGQVSHCNIRVFGCFARVHK